MTANLDEADEERDDGRRERTELVDGRVNVGAHADKQEVTSTACTPCSTPRSLNERCTHEVFVRECHPDVHAFPSPNDKVLFRGKLHESAKPVGAALRLRELGRQTWSWRGGWRRE